MPEIKSVLVYLGATMPANPIFVDAVRELGKELATRHIKLVFGGSDEGTMTVLANAVMENGGELVGVFPKTLPERFLNKNLPEVIITEDIAQRKQEMLRLSDAALAMPGSFGTWDELFDALELAKVELLHGRAPKPIGLLNLNGFYDGIALLLQRSIDEGYTTPQYKDLLRIEPTVPKLLESLLN